MSLRDAVFPTIDSRGLKSTAIFESSLRDCTKIEMRLGGGKSMVLLRVAQPAGILSYYARMHAPFRSPWVRAALLGAAMGTAYFIGQREGRALSATIATKVPPKPGPAHRMTALEQASADFDHEEKFFHGMISHKYGDVILSVDGSGYFYIGKVDIGELMRMDPQQALRELAKLPHGAETYAAYRYAFKSAAEPAGAELAATLPPGPEQLAAVLGIASGGWAKEDPKAALDWMGTLPASDAPAMEEAILSACQDDPVLASKYIGDIADASARN